MSNSECQSAFGVGFTCGEEGFCLEASAFPRCRRTYPPELRSSPAFGDAFVIGSIADESLVTHVDRQQSVELAVSQIEEETTRPGSLFGRAVGVVFCTNQADFEQDGLEQNDASAAIATYLVNEVGVSAIVGPPSSGATRSVFNAVGMANAAVLVISPSATSDSLTALEPLPSDAEPGILWRTAPPDRLQGRAIAEDIWNRGSRSIAIVAEQSEYAQNLEAVFRERFVDDLAGSAESFDFAMGSDAQRDAASGMAADARFDEVLFIAQTSDAVAFLRFANGVDSLQGRPLFLTDTAKNTDFLDGADVASRLFPNVRGTFPAPEDTGVFRSFAGAYSARFGDAGVGESSFTAHAYDAAWLAVIGGVWATLQEDDLSARALSRGLRQVLEGPEVPLRAGGIEAIEAAFATGQSVDVLGASGGLDYDRSVEELLGAQIEIWAIELSQNEDVFEFVTVGPLPD